MDLKRFWDIIAFCCRPGASAREWHFALKGEVPRLGPNDIVAFGHQFDTLTSAAYTFELWQAAYFINGGASDDGFYYFRCWLVGMGKAVYESALANPDSLADVVERGKHYEAEIYNMDWLVWEKATRLPEEKLHELRDALGRPSPPKLADKAQNVPNRAKFRQRLPRLAAMYLRPE
jgi:hypothetical protein